MRGMIGLMLVMFATPLWQAPLSSLAMTGGEPMHGWPITVVCLFVGLMGMAIGSTLIYQQLRKE